MRITLLEPTASVLGLSTYAAHNILEPLGIEYLASYLEALGHNCQVVQQRCEQRDKILSEIIQQHPDILGISTQAYNIDDALWFSKEAKEILPELVVVLGGYHASALPELVEKPEVDYVIIGEGEAAFAELITAVNGEKTISDVPGVAYFDGIARKNPRMPRIDNLDSLPFPKRNKDILSQCRMHGLMYPPPSRQIDVGMITATRGCPYSCTFCCSQLIWNHKIKSRSPQNVADELEIMHSEYDVNGVFFCDLTFNANKKYAIALCEEIARRNVPIHFYAMCHLKGMDREIAEAMAAAQCAKVGFGVESFIEPTRLSMKDRGGVDLEDTNRVLDEVSAAGVLTKAYFIIGFPWETLEMLKQLQNDIDHIHADEIKAKFYVPLPGTRGYEMHRSLLTHNNWSEFTTLSTPVVRNDNVSAEDLKRIRHEIFAEFYNGHQWLNRVPERVAQFPKYLDSFVEFAAFLSQQDILRSEIPQLKEYMEK